MITRKEGSQYDFGQMFFKPIRHDKIQNNCPQKFENSYLIFSYLLLSIAFTSIATASFEDISELK
jgi:hypothetical protein